MKSLIVFVLIIHVPHQIPNPDIEAAFSNKAKCELYREKLIGDGLYDHKHTKCLEVDLNPKYDENHR